jgi:hypothetical protein
MMSDVVERLDVAERAREKRRSREQDARDLASGAKCVEDLRRENGVFVFPEVLIDTEGSQALE